MNENKNTNTKKSIALAIAGVVLAGVAGGIGGYVLADDSAKVADLQNEIAQLQSQEPLIVTEIVEKEVEVIKNVTQIVEKEVLVDNANLSKVMSFVEDNYDEDLTVDYIVFEIDAINSTENLIRNKFVELLEDADFFKKGEVLRGFSADELSIRKLSDYTIVSRDFEDKDLNLSYELTIKAKEDKSSENFTFVIEVPFEAGKIVADEIVVELKE
jgi:hypothetical protein